MGEKIAGGDLPWMDLEKDEGKRSSKKTFCIFFVIYGSFCCATKDKYLIINFACTSAWLYP